MSWGVCYVCKVGPTYKQVDEGKRKRGCRRSCLFIPPEHCCYCTTLSMVSPLAILIFFLLYKLNYMGISDTVVYVYRSSKCTLVLLLLLFGAA
ncbi:uncharacterized protein DS421_9g282060 [Arachis hypogaea]|nr:uncharacterized protein DS421_9g282060 [Arachis hypogaea]